MLLPEWEVQRSVAEGRDPVKQRSRAAARRVNFVAPFPIARKPRFRLGLALSGGGMKGVAHAGVLSVFDDLGLAPDCLAGVSAGGLVAVLYSLGWTPPAIREYMRETRVAALWERDLDGHAFFGSRKFLQRIRQAVGAKTFADLRRPVAVVTVDLQAGREVVIFEGRLDEALWATMAIPGIFAPRLQGAAILCDGGVLNPVPADVARRMGARKVIAVDVRRHRLPLGGGAPRVFEERPDFINDLMRRMGIGGMLETFDRSIGVSSDALVEAKFRDYPPDLVIVPQAGHIGLFDSDRADEAYALGIAAARACREELLRLRPRNVRGSWRETIVDWLTGGPV